jgi:hypothetical protein
MRPVPEVADVDLAFPARGGELAPAWNDIPDEFKRSDTPEVRLFGILFAGATLPAGATVQAREGVDQEKALRVLRVVMGSYALKHEHKVASWAMLCREWFEIDW